MSLITQCPACATMFRVVPDQLRISEGWVRCGQCDEVFDANAHMQSTQAPTEDAAPVPTPPVHAPSFSAEAADPLDPASSINAGYDWGALAHPHEPQHVAEPASQVDANATSHFAEEPVSLPDVAVAEENTEAEPYLEASHFDLPVMEDAMAVHYAPPVEDGWQPDSQPAADVTEEAALPEAADDAPLSFMPRAEPASRWGRMFGKRTMVAVCSLLLLLLGLQFLIVDRDRIAATFPGVRPLLTSACGLLGCSLSAPRQIESIAIDSSAFTSIKPGIYLLNVTLKNAATLALASPALELTLTDMQDRPLLRRVILAQEYVGKTQVMEAGAELSSSIPVAVRAGSVIENIAGYKLLAFYP